MTQVALTLLLWVTCTGAPWRLPLGAEGLSQSKAPETLLQTSYSQPHLVLRPLERLHLHGVEDVQHRGGQQDGEAEPGQQVEGCGRERLLGSQSQPGHGSDGQLQEQQSHAHHPGALRRVAHPLCAVQPDFDLSTGLCHDVNQLGQLP